MLFVTKKDGTLRLVYDYRALNEITIKQHFPLPRIDDIFDKLGGCKYFSSLDLTSAYNQLRLPPEEVERTAFVVPFGQYASRVLNFGLTNAPSVFCAEMTKAFQGLIGTCMVIYLDDILIFSKTMGEHVTHLRQVLTILRRSQFKAKLSKCSFCQQELQYLGHQVGKDGLSVDQKKVQAVAAWPVPGTVKQLQSFQGLCNYFRRFLPGFSTLSAPLTALTRKEAPWVWISACQTAFDTIKRQLTTAPVLQFPDFDKPFTVVSDASLLGTGAVLLQDEKPVCYTSSKFNSAELNYSTTEQELLAVLRAFVEWRCYLEGGKFPVTVVTDHNPLAFLSSQTNLSRRQARWSEYLQRFNHVWQYIPGRNNMADPLSRCPVGTLGDSPAHILPGPPSLCSVTRLQVHKPIQELLAAGYSEDPWFSKAANLEGLERDKQLLWRYGKSRGVLPLILVPNVLSVKLAILRELHDSVASGHPGPRRTYQSLRRWFIWPGMLTFVHDYVTRCRSCQQMKPAVGRQGGLLQPLPIPTQPWQSVSMDLLTCLPVTKDGYDTIAVFVDRLTKFCVAVPTKLTVDALDLPGCL